MELLLTELVLGASNGIVFFGEIDALRTIGNGTIIGIGRRLFETLDLDRLRIGLERSRIGLDGPERRRCETERRRRETERLLFLDLERIFYIFFFN